MILLRPDCLVFKAPEDEGEGTPCPFEQISLDLAGASAPFLDEHVLKNAADAVVQYFKNDLDKTVVTAGEFAEALQTALRALGLDVTARPSRGDPGPVAETDLTRLAQDSSSGWELLFFGRLRAEFDRRIEEAPRVLRFHGLRPCVKLLSGTRRWTSRCQALSDQIVNFLRGCLDARKREIPCALVVE